MPRRFSLIGDGRAGGSIRTALVDLGWECAAIYRRGDDVATAATGVDVCVIATSDGSIASVAAQVEPSTGVVVHLSGALGLDVLAPHRAGALHPLVSLADATSGAEQLRTAWFGVAGDPLAQEMANELSGRSFLVADADRASYHAASAIASNHFVALLGQVERIADTLNIPFDVFLPLVSSTLDNVDALGPRAALTGPAARGDMDTIDRHRAALVKYHSDELAAYDALVERAIRLRDGDRSTARTEIESPEQ